MLTLEEGAAWLGRHMPQAQGATESQLLRAGIAGALRICVPLDTRAYSPTIKARRDKVLRELGRNSREAYVQRLTRDEEADELFQATHEEFLQRNEVVPVHESPGFAPAYEMLGLFVVPPRHLFTLETETTVLLEVAISLDGKDSYFPHVQIRRDQLRVTEQHLRELAAQLEPPTAPAVGGPFLAPAPEHAAEPEDAANVVQADSETLVARHDRWLALCEAQGLRFRDPAAGRTIRLPRGIKGVAAAAGVARSTFRDGVMNALERRYAARRGAAAFGVTQHRIE